MPPKLRNPKPRAQPKKHLFEKKADPKKLQITIPQQKRTYKELISDIVKSDYIKNLPQAIAGIIITGLLTKYALFGSNRTTPTNAEDQAIDNLTSNVMHDLFFEEVNKRQIVDNLHEGLSEIDHRLRSQLSSINGEESKDGDGMWLQFYVDPNKGEWV